MSRVSFETPKGTILPIMTMRGNKEYLQVAHRLVWFREECPNWSIETEIYALDEKGAVVRAIIRDEKGRVIATSTKSEDIQGFADYLEKAETGSIGRALALCGFGTQFTDDFDEGERLADSPLPQGRPQGAQAPAVAAPASRPAIAAPTGRPALVAPAPAARPMPQNFNDEVPDFPPPQRGSAPQGGGDTTIHSCGNKMMLSKYPNRETGQIDWYCGKCRVAVPKG